MTNPSFEEVLSHPTTASVFAYLRKKNQAVGVREVQHKLNIPSSATAFWHLNKLAKSNIVKQLPNRTYVMEDEYLLINQVPLTIIMDHFLLYGKYIPQYYIIILFSLLVSLTTVILIVVSDIILVSFFNIFSFIVLLIFVVRLVRQQEMAG